MTKRAVSLLTVVALLLTMFTGMMFTVSAEGDGTVTTLLPITDASDWTGRTDKITTNGTFAAVTGEGNERVITSVDTFNFGNQLMVSGTLVQRAFSGNQTAKSYVKVGNPITEVYPTGDVTRIIINYQTNEVFAAFVNHGIWKIGRQY